jgi:hypothetical protein
MRLFAPQLLGPGVLLCAMAVAGCTSSEEAVYSIQITGPADAFVGASSVVLYKREQEIARTAVKGQGAFTLEVGGIDPSENEGTAIFIVRGLDAMGQLVAYGETPLLETLPTGQDLKIFVQRPGSVARSTDFPVKLRNQTIFKAETQPTTSVDLVVTAPVFAHGEGAEKRDGVDVKVFSRSLYIYNPLNHLVERIIDLPQARSEAVGISRADGALFLFGGFLLPAAAPTPTEGLKASQQLDLLVVGRENFKKFTLPTEVPPQLTADPATARAGAVVAAAGPRRLLIGGIDDYTTRTPLASVATLEEPSMNVFAVRPHKPMTVPRMGHTATSDPSPTAGLPSGTVLVYGGALTAAGPVAELLNPATEEFTPLVWTVAADAPAHPETNRKFHQAVVLPNKDATTSLLQVLIVGGLDDQGNPRADSVLCLPSLPPNPAIPGNQCKAGPITLKTPRAHFAAFVLNNDLVVTGGLGPGNVPIGTTEIYDARTLAFVSEVPSLARSHVTATTLPNLSAVISGGLLAGDDPATAIEIFQPRRAN